jgi:primase-polymerase (primpol)-like protein
MTISADTGGVTGATGPAGVIGPRGSAGVSCPSTAPAISPAKTSANAPPKLIYPDFERIPHELKSLKNWVLWVPIWDGARWTEHPVQVSGFDASTSNPKHWSSFDQVKQVYERAVERGYIKLRKRKNTATQQIPMGGVGFMFDGRPDKDGLVFAGVEFEGGRSSFAIKCIKSIGSYFEEGTFGTALHVILKAHPLACGIAHNRIEMFTAGRFLAMSGRSGPFVLTAAPVPFAALAAELQNAKGSETAEVIRAAVISGTVEATTPVAGETTEPAAPGAMASVTTERAAPGALASETTEVAAPVAMGSGRTEGGTPAAMASERTEGDAPAAMASMTTEVAAPIALASETTEPAARVADVRLPAPAGAPRAVGPEPAAPLVIAAEATEPATRVAAARLPGPAGAATPVAAKHQTTSIATSASKGSAGPEASPSFLPPNFDGMPIDLKQRRIWVLWIAGWTGSKWTKRPIQPSGFGASTTNPKHWSSFEEVKEAYERATSRGHIEVRDEGKRIQRVGLLSAELKDIKVGDRFLGGVGIVFDGRPDEDGLVLAGVDFDDAISPGNQISSFAQEQVKKLGSYVEVSVSRTGLHMILRARPLASGINHRDLDSNRLAYNKLEMYTSGRFFTMTGGPGAACRAIIAAPIPFATLAEELQRLGGNPAAIQADRPPANEATFTLPESFTNGPAAAFATAAGADESLADGIKTQWFAALSPELKDAVVDHALGVIGKNTKLLELEAGGGNNAEYYKLTTAVARSGAPHAEDIFIKHASSAKNADTVEELRRHYFRCRDSKPSGKDEVTVGTLLFLAQQNGANFDQWKRQMPSVPALPPEKRKPLKGGTYSPHEGLELLNSHYFIGRGDQEINIFRIKDDGLLAFAPLEQFKLDVANIFVRPAGGSAKPLPVEKFWKESPQRHERTIVFKPAGATTSDEFNLWRGFGVEPRMGWQKQRRFLRHMRQIICRRDKPKFKYLIRYLAWAVQNPDKHPGVVIVLKSRKEGTGKSTLGVVMRKIFGQHGALIDNKERLLGRFNDWLEDKCFILAEEILWAADHKTADQIKSLITGNTIRIERKFGGSWEIPNRLHILMTTNHDHAVTAGVGDRRNVVYDTSDERACDKSWFDPLYQDLDDGGSSEFLYFLLHLKLGAWHPRQILKTAEATEQQRMSADSISQWSRACVEADAIVGAAHGFYAAVTTHDLGTRVTTEVLREAYTGYCKQQGMHATNGEVFGKACAEMFGPRKRLKAQQGLSSNTKRRPWGYDVPSGNRWQAKLDTRLGIKK